MSEPDKLHQFAVTSADYSRPFLLGCYETIDQALLAQGGKPEKWEIFVRLATPAPNPAPAAGPSLVLRTAWEIEQERLNAKSAAPPLGRFWLELREPGCVPLRKGPWLSTDTAKVLREFMEARPNAYITVVTVNDGEPLFQDAPECLQMTDGRSMQTGRKHIASSNAAHAALVSPAPAEGEAVPVAWRYCQHDIDGDRWPWQFTEREGLARQYGEYEPLYASPVSERGGVEVTEAMVERAMDRAGWTVKPTPAEYEGGALIDLGISQEDADQLNADLRTEMRDILTAALASLAREG